MALRFIFDQHVNARALRRLREEGVDLVHVAEVGLSEGDDPEILAWAARQGRIVVTRNYRDFAPLVQAYADAGRDQPGVLFFSSSVGQADAGHHVRALHQWIREAQEAASVPVRNGLGGLG